MVRDCVPYVDVSCVGGMAPRATAAGPQPPPAAAGAVSRAPAVAPAAPYTKLAAPTSPTGKKGKRRSRKSAPPATPPVCARGGFCAACPASHTRVAPPPSPHARGAPPAGSYPPRRRAARHRAIAALEWRGEAEGLSTAIHGWGVAPRCRPWRRERAARALGRATSPASGHRPGGDGGGVGGGSSAPVCLPPLPHPPPFARRSSFPISAPAALPRRHLHCRGCPCRRGVPPPSAAVVPVAGRLPPSAPRSSFPLVAC